MIPRMGISNVIIINYKNLKERKEKQMRKIIINNIRNIGRLEFEIPDAGVHVITGENGVGKTTLFTCLSRICNNNAYRNGFPNSNLNYYDEYRGTITYRVDEQSVVYSRRASGKWQPDVKNNIFDLYGFTSVVHISTRSERIFTQIVEVARKKQAADSWLIDALNRILNTERFTPMIRITVGDLRSRNGNADKRRRNTAFAIPVERGYYTEQNFSFGEIVLLNLLYDIENVENNSLVLVDELEMALHPAAQIRLMQYLEEMATQKNMTILISTHSASIIKAQKSVILLERSASEISVYKSCPAAKAIGAIGMREETMADIIIIVEDEMAKAFFTALLKKYTELCPESNFLDIRIVGVGGYQNVIKFYVEAENYIFYDNIYVAAFLDKDVETDIIPYPIYGNKEIINLYNENRRKIHFLPFTPEVLLYKKLKNEKDSLLAKISLEYYNHQVNYEMEDIDIIAYEVNMPALSTQEEYNAMLQEHGRVRTRCKDETKRVVSELAHQLNVGENELYRFIFKYAADTLEGTEINVRSLLSAIMKRYN